MGDPLAPTGNTTAEYQSLRSAVGKTSGRSRLITVTGPDAVSFLQGLLSQDLTDTDGGVQRTFLLQPNGKLTALMWLALDADGVILLVDAGVADEVAQVLKRFRIRVDAEVVLDERAVVELWGPQAPETASVEPGTFERRGDGVVVSARIGALPRVFVVGVDVQAASVGSLALEAVRIEAGEPVVGIDIDERTIPQESGLVDESVSFTKGCYLGQELVARIDTRGHVNKRLVGLRMTEAVLPPVGAVVADADRGEVGSISSVAESLTLRAPLGLGMVRREIGDGMPVTVQWDGGSAGAVVTHLPFDDFTND